MGILQRLGVDTEEGALEYVEDFIRTQNTKQELDLYLLAFIGIGLQYFPEEVARIIARDKTVKTILAGHKVSESVIVGYGNQSKEFEEVMGWIPPIDDVCRELNKLKSHLEALKKRINGILESQSDQIYQSYRI